MHALRIGGETYHITLGGRLAGADPGDDLLGADELVLAQSGEGTVKVGVRAEFLHDGDVQTDALPIGGDPEGFGTDTQGQAGLTPGLCEDLTGHGDHVIADPDAAIGNFAFHEVHGGGADEARDEQVLRGVVQGQRGIDLLQDAVLHHRDPVSHRHGLHLVVGDVDGGDAETPLQRGDLGAGGHAQLRVEVRQRLVHQEHLRLAHDGAAHGDALPLTAGEGLRFAGKEVLEPQQVGGLPDPLLPFRLGHVLHLQREAHVVGDGHVRVEGVVLEDHRDVAILRRQVGDVAVTDEDRTRVDLLEAGEHAERSGLAAAGGADEDHELAVGDFQVELVDCGAIRAGVDTRGFTVADSGHATFPFHGQVRARRSVVVEVTLPHRTG